MAKTLPRTMHRKTIALETEINRDSMHSSVFGPWAVRSNSPFRFSPFPKSEQSKGGDNQGKDDEISVVPTASKGERHDGKGTLQSRELHRKRLEGGKRSQPAKSRADDVNNPQKSPMLVMSFEEGGLSIANKQHNEPSRQHQEQPKKTSRALEGRKLPSLSSLEDQEFAHEPSRPFTSLGFVDGPSNFEDILPSSSGRTGGRSAALMWQQKRYLGIGYGSAKKHASGARSCELVESHAAQMFGMGGDVSNMQGMGKFVEARALELQLADVVANGKRLLEVPPLSQARRKFYSYQIPAVFSILAAVIEAVGPFGTILTQLRDQVHVLCYSDEIDHSDQEPRAIPNVELVAQLRRDKDNIYATLNSASMLTSKADKDIAKLNNENRDLEQRILQLDRQLMAEKRVYGDLEDKLKYKQEEYDELLSNFKELQKGFMLGQLQDEMKEILLEGVGEEDAQGAVGESSLMEEQSAMQRLVRQLKDARESMLTATDDMNYWKAKYQGVEHRMRTITESYHDTTNSLELTKEKMLGMVPSAVHVALKERYQKVLDELGRLRHQLSKDKKKNRQPFKKRDRPHDNWRHYDAQEDRLRRGKKREARGSAGSAGLGLGEAGDVLDDEEESDYDEEEEEEEEEEHNELDDADTNVPSEFVDSVAAQRERLNQSYRTFRRLHGSAVVSWTSLRTMSLAEFARLEEDCFAKNSIWALQLLKEEETKRK